MTNEEKHPSLWLLPYSVKVGDIMHDENLTMRYTENFSAVKIENFIGKMTYFCSKL